MKNKLHSIQYKEKKIVVIHFKSNHLKNVTIYFLKSQKLPMIDFVLKFCSIYFSL